ncbi:DoxX family protein [Robiginitalea marina]|uniref:DoxX family protein n=1 Tax=Robiginitalea marina TaxID=2954105 RepID=A0ABT1AZP2_9FLAO|nr:DoxX family protein [Robiginitalea marina]MCO5725055.1 DoxX family protein [Robiginitalea marina]
MGYLVLAAKIIIFLTIANVWFLRFSRPTPYRGGQARNMREEFEAYGLSEAMLYMVGALKVLAAIGLLVSIWIPFVAIPSAAAMGFLMAGAIWMHLRVGDPLMKSMPALLFFFLSVFIWLQSTGSL